MRSPRQEDDYTTCFLAVPDWLTAFYLHPRTVTSRGVISQFDKCTKKEEDAFFCTIGLVYVAAKPRATVCFVELSEKVAIMHIYAMCQFWEVVFYPLPHSTLYPPEPWEMLPESIFPNAAATPSQCVL